MKYAINLLLLCALWICFPAATSLYSSDAVSEKPTILNTIRLINSGHKEKVADLMQLTPETEKEVKLLFKLYENDTSLYNYGLGGLEFILRKIQDPQLFPLLIKYSKTGKPETQIVALKTLARVGDNSVTQCLKDHLSSGNENMARIAAAGLVNIEHEKAIPTLIKHLKRENGQRVFAAPLASLGLPALQALLKEIELTGKSNQYIPVISTIGDASAIDTLLNLSRQWDGKFKQAAVEALINLGAGKLVLPEILKAIKGQDILNRPKMISFLGAIQDDGILSILKNILQGDSNKEMKLAAIMALGEQKQDAAIKILMDFYRTKNLGVDNSAFIEAISHSRGPLAVESLTELYREDPLRSRSLFDNVDKIAIGLGEIGDPAGIPLLKEIICSSNTITDYPSSLAIKSLAKIPGIEAENASIEILQTCNPPYRGHGILERLARNNNSKATDILISILSSQNGQFNELAVLALGKTGDIRAIPVLRRIFLSSEAILKVTKDTQKAHIFPALAELGEDVPVSDFIKSFSALNCCTQPIMNALKTYKNRSNTKFLKQIMDDKEAEIHLRLSAAQGLIQAGDNSGLSLARETLGDKANSTGVTEAIEVMKSIGEEKDIPAIQYYLGHYKQEKLFVQFDFEKAGFDRRIKQCKDAISAIQARGHQ